MKPQHIAVSILRVHEYETGILSFALLVRNTGTGIEPQSTETTALNHLRRR